MMRIDLSCHRVLPERLSSIGFRKVDKLLRLSRPLGVGDLTLLAEVRGDDLTCRVLDSAGDEYTLHQVAGAQGAFVGGVRSSIEAFRHEFISFCCVREEFHTPTIRALLAFAEREFGERPEFLWKQFPQDAILRRTDNRKWYAVFMVIPPTKIGLPEGNPIEIVDLRVTDAGHRPDGVRYFPGWHMNKKTWYTVVCNGSVPTEELVLQLKASRDCAARK